MACTNLASVSTFYRLLRASGETRGQLTLHADRGTSMRSKPVALLLADLGVTKSHSRPRFRERLSVPKYLVARLWQATNATARDFRLESIGEAWTSSVLSSTPDGRYEVQVPPPSAGWTAYFVELTYPDAGPQIYSTQVFMTPDRPRPFEEVDVTEATVCSQ